MVIGIVRRSHEAYASGVLVKSLRGYWDSEKVSRSVCERCFGGISAWLLG